MNGSGATGFVSSAQPGAVCAIVVTYNRRELLRECLEALLVQTVPLARILVVNNLSTDGTLEMIARDFGPRAPHLEVHTLAVNAGGAGGFHEGMQRAAEGEDFGWLWLMDDDTIPSSSALEEFLRTWERFPAERKPELLASKSVWTDGSIHPMNVPQIKPGDAAGAYLAAEHSSISIRTATFVSVLIRSRSVERYGLPIADYFIWGEDVEYTGRILRENVGVLVPASVVTHKTLTSYGPVEGSAARFYYFVRNGVWMLVWSAAWTRNERLKMTIGFFRVIAAFLRHTSERSAGLKSIARGFLDSVTRRPQR
jgi:GT2 family glycosyltransferase